MENTLQKDKNISELKCRYIYLFEIRVENRLDWNSVVLEFYLIPMLADF